MSPIEYGRRYVRFRIRSPRLFIKSSFRTFDIGKPKRHMLVRGIRKGTGKWQTQAVLIEKHIWKKDKKTTREIIRRAKRY